ncbi:hypothetical protein JST97_29865 [bacterium]|nr:hypothetical protein [bacterium]
MKVCPRAFSLLELLLALGTMAATLLLVIALAISVAGRNQQVQEVPVGLIAAEDVLNQFVYNVQSNSAAQTAFFSNTLAPNYATDTIQIDRVNFSYAVDLERLIDTSGNPVGGAALSGTNHLMRITVRVSWQMGSGPNQGKHQAELSRILHEDN